jgi:hypothetical protein
MRRAESELQIACVNWFRMRYPHFRMLLFSVPNGGMRNKGTAIRMKREGVVAGVSDLFLSVPRGEWHGFYIEMKAGDGKMTEKQEDFFRYASKYGYRCRVVNSFDMFVREIENYLDLQGVS